MKREIKFRAWDKTMECWATDPFHMFINFNGCVSNFQNGSGGAEYDLEQFTGLNDKNGKEIYEGDILSAGDGGLFQVDFPYGGWSFTTTKSSKYTSYPSPWSSARRMEIIGNIHENPELIGGEK